MRTGQPDQAPHPGHDPIDVVPAAAGRQPATTGEPMRDGVHEAGRLAHRGRRDAQVGERIPGMRVGAVLRHDEVRPERGGQLGEQRAHRVQPRALPGPRLERDVHRCPRRRSLAELPHPARPREEIPAGLMERQRQDARIRPVDRLDAIAVVDVQVNVEHAQAVLAGAGDRQRRVVVDAEARRPIAHGVVQAATRVEGVVRPRRG